MEENHIFSLNSQTYQISLSDEWRTVAKL